MDGSSSDERCRPDLERRRRPRRKEDVRRRLRARWAERLAGQSLVPPLRSPAPRSLPAPGHGGSATRPVAVSAAAPPAPAPELPWPLQLAREAASVAASELKRLLFSRSVR